MRKPPRKRPFRITVFCADGMGLSFETAQKLAQKLTERNFRLSRGIHDFEITTPQGNPVSIGFRGVVKPPPSIPKNASKLLSKSDIKNADLIIGTPILLDIYERPDLKPHLEELLRKQRVHDPKDNILRRPTSSIKLIKKRIREHYKS